MSTTRPGESRRQQVIERLCEAYARDEVGLEEFERRVETAHRADTASSLDALLSDLGPAPVPTRGSGAADDAGSVGGRRRPGPVQAGDLVAGILGGAMRRGRWTPARKIKAVAIMGGVELDFRDAVFPPGVTEVHAFALWGGIEILAPPGVRVECNGAGILGGFDHREDGGSDAADARAVLRVTGVAVMGGVDVKVRSTS